MKKIFILVFSFCFCFAKVGVKEQTFIDKKRDRSIKTFILYPTNDTKKEEVFGANPVFYGFKGIKDAKLFGKDLPVYFLAHGTSGNWRNLSWLGYKLANEGAIVISANYPKYTSGEATPNRLIRPWDQPLDISFLIDKISDKYQLVINKKDINVIGHSLGGYTALALAGARFKVFGYESYCKNYQDVSCKYFKDAFKTLTEKDRDLFSKSYKDKRVKNVVAIAPGFIPAIVQDSLKDLSAKVLIISAQFLFCKVYFQVYSFRAASHFRTSIAP
jgi:predicted dienelactone hydrolase